MHFRNGWIWGGNDGNMPRISQRYHKEVWIASRWAASVRVTGPTTKSNSAAVREIRSDLCANCFAIQQVWYPYYSCYTSTLKLLPGCAKYGRTPHSIYCDCGSNSTVLTPAFATLHGISYTITAAFPAARPGRRHTARRTNNSNLHH
jgi:hypothetical protein